MIFRPTDSNSAWTILSCRVIITLLILSFFIVESQAGSADDIDVLRERYRQWLLDDASTDYSLPPVRRQFEGAIHRARQAATAAAEIDFDDNADLYDTRRSGPDRKELFLLVTKVLPHLSVAYHLRGARSGDNPFYHDDETLGLILRTFDRLDRRGFRPGMQMPWKVRECRITNPPTALIVNFHLRTSGYAVATFLMRDQLEATGRLERSLQTCEDICTHDEKTGGLDKLKLNADAIRIATNVILPYALAAGNEKRLMHLKWQFDRSMAIESDASDTIKPDGLGFHHLGVYHAGYAPFAVAQATQIAWLTRNTRFALSAETIANLRKSMLILRVVSQKYDMHKALAGRLRNIAVIPDVLFGYVYLAAIEGDDIEMKQVLARLCDDAFLQSDLRDRPLTGARDEPYPGPGAVEFYFHTLASARQAGAEPDPTGHWALNYGPLSVHRRNNWMVSAKGYSRYFWAFERSLSDALGEDRMQNVLGFHDSSCSIRIYNQGEPVGAEASGYTTDGWDWCLQPGATVRHIPSEIMFERSLDLSREDTNRPFAQSGFAGGVSLAAQHGLFAMEYSEASCDASIPRLTAKKSVFFFDDQIVVLTSDIQGGDGEFPVVTTLYQCGLASSNVPTFVSGERRTGLDQIERLSDGQPATLVDPAGNGYYIPQADNLIVTRRRQHSLGYTGLRKASGDFAAAWFDHGRTPDHAGCEYAILVDCDADRLSDFAAHSGDYYKVLRRDAIAHIVSHAKLNLTGYAIFKANTRLQQGIVEQVNTPCLVMTQGENQPTMRMSVCNPDLDWTKGKEYAFRPKDREDSPPVVAPVTPVRVKLRGVWQLSKTADGVSVRAENGSTVVRVDCSDAKSVEFTLRPSK